LGFRLILLTLICIQAKQVMEDQSSWVTFWTVYENVFTDVALLQLHIGDKSLTCYFFFKTMKTHETVSQRIHCKMVSLTLKYQFIREWIHKNTCLFTYEQTQLKHKNFLQIDCIVYVFIIQKCKIHTKHGLRINLKKYD